MKQYLNHTIGILLVLPLLVFFFYKSIFSVNPFEGTYAITQSLKSLQVELHRDILRYRNNQIRQYDTINQTTKLISELNKDLVVPVEHNKQLDISGNIIRLKKSFQDQAELVEDFKTNNSVLQNSLFYYSRVHTELDTVGLSGLYENVSVDELGRLSTLILEYTRKPEPHIAQKIYPILDNLNSEQSSELRTLINHSLIIIERLPLIDRIIRQFNSLDIEKQLDDLVTAFKDHQATLDQQSRIYNSLLFFCSLYLLGYISYMIIILKQNRNILVAANKQLTREVDERTRTEQTLYRLVEETSHISERDYIFNILHALHKSLNIRYAYISLVTDPESHVATMLGVLDNSEYHSDIQYRLGHTPCEEVLRTNRLVHNRDLQNYFAGWHNTHLSRAESYIGITLRDEKSKVIGVLAIADDKPIKNTNLAENILSLAASRASTEIARHIALRDSERYHTGLELIDNWLLQLIASADDIDKFHENISKAAREIGNANMALVPLMEKSGEYYTFVAASGHKSQRLIGTRLPVGDGCLCGWSMQNRQNVRIDDVNKDSRSRRQLTNQYDVKTAYITPIYLNNEVYGAITVFRDKTPFDEIDEQLINQFAQRIQLAITNLQLINVIAAEKERAQVTLHSIADAVITTNVDGKIEYMNEVAQSLTGWPFTKVLNEPVQTVFRIIDRDTREPMQNLIETCMDESTPINKSIILLIDNSGNEKTIECSISPIISKAGKSEGVVIVFHDLSKRRYTDNILLHRANHRNNRR